jgi:Cu/Ag efflux protein CusF
MKRWLLISGGFVTAALLSAGLAFGQTGAQPKAAGAQCSKKPLEKVEGQVTSVDQQSGKVTIKDKNGATHEFQASADTLKEMKPGDTVEARLRAVQC